MFDITPITRRRSTFTLSTTERRKSSIKKKLYTEKNTLYVALKRTWWAHRTLARIKPRKYWLWLYTLYTIHTRVISSLIHTIHSLRARLKYPVQFAFIYFILLFFVCIRHACIFKLNPKRIEKNIYFPLGSLLGRILGYAVRTSYHNIQIRQYACAPTK